MLTRTPPWEINRVWYPDEFGWEHDKNYDYYLLHVEKAPLGTFGAQAARFQLRNHVGNWWLYKIRRSGGQSREVGVRPDAR